MKLNKLRKGFTLVEIMIVVVIIGLLAALAIPAFKKVRNNAIEKSLLNDARQVSSAVQQYCSENAGTQAPWSSISKYLNGGSLSSGVLISNGSNITTVAAPSATNLYTIGTTSDNYFSLGHPQFDKSVSTNGKVNGSGPVTNSGSIVKFTTDDGQPST